MLVEFNLMNGDRIQLNLDKKQWLIYAVQEIVINLNWLRNSFNE